MKQGRRDLVCRWIASIFPLAVAFAFLSCTSKSAPQPKASPYKPSDIKIEVKDGGPVVITTTAAEFQVLPSGFLQATLRLSDKHLTLDEPVVGSTGGNDSIVSQGKELDFVPDFGHTKVLEASGKLGRGKRVEIPAHPLAPSGVPMERMLVI